MNAAWCIALPLLTSLAVVSVAESGSERELIQDNHFRSGFILYEPKPGRHVRYGELKGLDATSAPVWGLLQWSSTFPLAVSSVVRSNGSLVLSNAAKGIQLGGGFDFSMAANSLTEYGARARTVSDPWVHLLVEQEFAQPAKLSELSSAKLHIEARLVRSRNLHQGDYSPDVHAAQFQIFFTVQNRNQQSKGFGDLLWFGIPIYDNRNRYAHEFKAQDFGGTAKFIFTPSGRTFATNSTHDGSWVVIDKDLRPLIHEALKTAWARGFLKESKTIEDYYIGGMNMGWELPGTFDVEMHVRNLSLMIKPQVAR
jgi:hypothetical protein